MHHRAVYRQPAGSTTGILRVYLLGPPEVTWAGQPLVIRRRLPRALLYHLVARLRPVSREQLCFLFWPDIPDANARRNLTIQLTHLRRALPDPQVLVAADGQVRLDPDRVWSDVAIFERLSSARESYRLAESLQQAVDLYRGPFLAGFSLAGGPEFEAWASQEGYRLERVYLEALSTLVEVYATAGQYEAAISCAQRYLAADEMAEEVHRRLIELYATSGDRSSALRQFERCAMVLEQELGVEPLPETRAVYEAALEGALLPPAPVSEAAWATLPGLDIPLIGREGVLNQLAGAYASARAGQGGVILIGGEAGIGKSRLMQEFATRWEGQALILNGAGYRDVQTMPYQPVVEALRSAFQHRTATTYPWADVQDRVQRVWLAEASRLLPELGDLVPDLPAPIDVGPEQARPRLFEALSQLTLGLAQGPQPVLLCLDDVHWADSTTLEWLVYLGRRLRGSRLLVIGTYRREEADAVSGLRRGLARLGILIDLNLTALHEADVLDLLHHLDGDEYDVAAVADRLQRTTGGNPFFLMETLRAHIEAGQKLEDLGRVKDLPISETVRETVAVRLGRLAPVARQVLEAGAVLGSLFRFEVVHRTAGRGEMEALDGLDELLDRQVLVEQEIGYQFHHEIIRAVVYGDLSHGRRRLLHRRAGEALEREENYPAAVVARSGAPPAKPEWVKRRADKDRMAGIAAQLARHFQEGGIAEKAIGYWKQAGDAAAAVYANEEALAHYSRALALLPEDDLAARCALLLDRERVYNLLGDRDAQSDDLDVLQSLAEELGDLGKQAEVAWRQATSAEATGDYPLATESAEQAIALAREAGEEQCVVDGHLAWGQALERQGNYDLARDHWSEALELALAADLTHSASKCLHALAFLEYTRGDYDAAQSFLERGLAIIRETGDLQAETDQLNLLGLLFSAVGDYATARATYQQVIKICHEIGNRLIEGYAHNNLGIVGNHLGAYQEARKHHESSLAIFTEIGNRMGQGAAFENLGTAALDQGDCHTAQDYFEQGLAIFREIGNRPFEGVTLTQLGNALVGLGELAEAAGAYQQAVALWREVGQQGMALVSQTGLARVALAQGDLAQAQSLVVPMLEFLDAGRGPGLTLMHQMRYLYPTSYQVLKASQDPRAEEILETAYQLLQEQAAKIPDEETRRAFLEDVAWHRQIVTWYEPAVEAV